MGSFPTRFDYPAGSDIKGEVVSFAEGVRVVGLWLCAATGTQTTLFVLFGDDVDVSKMLKKWEYFIMSSAVQVHNEFLSDGSTPHLCFRELDIDSAEIVVVKDYNDVELVPLARLVSAYEYNQ